MVNPFEIFDLSLLVLAIILLSLFVYRKKKKFSIDGPMYLYRTKFGLKVIDWVGKKHSKFLDVMLYPLFIISYGLMIVGVFYFLYIIFEYLTNPIISQMVKAPPILPIFPYFTQFFGLNTFFPTFYFISFIISIGIAIVVHEFSHGIYARRFNIKIKSTGFALLRLFKIPLPFFGAFVEQDDKQMVKAPKKAQLAVLGAGVFANMIITFLFIGILWGFFALAFHPAGVVFDDYSTTVVNFSNVQEINGIPISSFNMADISGNSTDLARLQMGNVSFYTSVFALNQTFAGNYQYLMAYEDTPAFEVKLRGFISMFDGVQITSRDELSKLIKMHKPGDTVHIQTNYNGQILNYELNLSQRNGVAYLGIASSGVQFSSATKKILYYITMITPKKANYITGVVYQSSIGGFGVFIFDLIWWIILINFAVAICNMLPVGIFDGGRFFMLSVLGITGNKKFAERAFKWVTIFFLALVAIWMVKWAFSYF